MTVVVAAVVLLVAEIVALVEVAKAIGVAPAVVLLLVVSASGPWLVRRAGFGVWRRTQQRLAAGEFPGREALDGLVLLAGGLLVCIPGFITDVIGLLLLLPPMRALARRVVAARMGRRLVDRMSGRGPAGTEDHQQGPADQVLDVDSRLTGRSADEPRPPRRPLSPGDPPDE